jgi:outer membrane protein assembly factor BamD
MMKFDTLLPVFFSLLLIAGCSSLGGKDNDTDASAGELYQEAQAAMRSNNNQTAIERLETLQSRYPFGEHAQQAQLDIINLYYKAGELDAAIAAADRFIRLNPTHPRVDYALYMRASTSMARGRDFISRTFKIDRTLRDPQPLRQAFADFKRLLIDFPDSRYSDDARRQMVILRNQLAQHELAIAEYYQSRSAYVAAANRAKGIIENYQETTAIKPALEILADAYQHLDLPDLRADTLRIIELNYP